MLYKSYQTPNDMVLLMVVVRLIYANSTTMSRKKNLIVGDSYMSVLRRKFSKT